MIGGWDQGRVFGSEGCLGPGGAVIGDPQGPQVGVVAERHDRSVPIGLRVIARNPVDTRTTATTWPGPGQPAVAQQDGTWLRVVPDGEHGLVGLPSPLPDPGPRPRLQRRTPPHQSQRGAEGRLPAPNRPAPREAMSGDPRVARCRPRREQPALVGGNTTPSGVGRVRTAGSLERRGMPPQPVAGRPNRIETRPLLGFGTPEWNGSYSRRPTSKEPSAASNPPANTAWHTGRPASPASCAPPSCSSSVVVARRRTGSGEAWHKADPGAPGQLASSPTQADQLLRQHPRRAGRNPPSRLPRTSHWCSWLANPDPLDQTALTVRTSPCRGDRQSASHRLPQKRINNGTADGQITPPNP